MPTTTARPLALGLDDLYPRISDAAGQLVRDGHFHADILTAALALRDLLREASGLHHLDGAALAGGALGGTSPPIRLADLTTSDGRREQDGWRMFAQGCVVALRNPAAHRRTEGVGAMEALALMSTIARRIESASAQRVPDRPAV